MAPQSVLKKPGSYKQVFYRQAGLERL